MELIEYIKWRVWQYFFKKMLTEDEMKIIYRATTLQLERDRMDDLLISSRLTINNDYSVQEETIQKLEKLNSTAKFIIFYPNNYKVWFSKTRKQLN